MKHFILVFSSLLFLYSVTSYAETVPELLQKSNDAFQKQQFSTSLIHLKIAAKENPKNLSIRLELIKLFVFTGQGVQAQAEIEKAIRLNANSKQITILQAKTQMLLGEFDAVTDGFNFIDLPQQDIARIRALQGHAFFEKRQFKKARLMFQRAYLLAPEPLEVQLGQARLFKIDGNTEQERILIESILKANPTNPEVLIIASEFYRSTKQFKKAISLLDKAGEIQSSNVNIWFGKVRSYIALGQLNKAKQEIQIVLTNFPEHQVGNYLLAVIAFEQNDFNRAKSAIDIVIKGKKRKFEAFKLLGTILFHQKQYTKAEINLKKFLKFNPNDIQALKTLAAIYLKRKQGSLAVNILHQLEQTSDPYVFSMLANAYQIMGNRDKSKIYFTKAIKLSPDNEIIKRQYQRTQLSSGDAIDIRFNDPNFEYFSTQGHIPILNLLRQKNYAEAAYIINGYLSKNKNNALLHFLLGTTQLYQKNIDEAKKSFHQSIALNPKLIEPKLSLAKTYMFEKNDREAEKLFREILKLQDNNDRAFVSLAGIFHRKGDDSKMLKWLNKSRKANKASLASREVLVDYYKRNNNIKKAVELSREMVEIQPDNITLLKKYAENLKISGRPDLSVNVYKKIVSLKPNSADSWYGLGKMQSFDDDLPQSYKSFEKVLTLAPNNFIAMVILTKYDVKNKNFNQALARAKKLVSTHPKKADSYDVLGDVYIAIDKIPTAIVQYKKSINIRFNSESYIKLFSAYNLNKQQDKGFRLLKSWVKQFPKNLQLKEVLAITYQLQGKFKQAQTLYENIIKFNKNNDRIFNNLALVSLELNSPMSMEYADIAYNINSKNASNLDTLGWVQLNNNNISGALEHLSQAVKLSPENPDYRYHFAVALTKAEKPRKAKTQLALIVQIEGKFDNRKEAVALYRKLK